jgi:arginyl-tRNA synthetase
MKDKILAILKQLLPDDTQIELSVPEQSIFGDYSTNVAMKVYGSEDEKKSHIEKAKDLVDKINKIAPNGFFKKIEVAGPGFINFWLSNNAIQDEFFNIINVENYGRNEDGKGKTIIVEYSSPNIAKTLNVGHLRNTIIGEALSNIFEFSGYNVIRWNYLGDWGTQFGKLIYAYKTWGKKEDVEKNPVEELQKLYVRFHEAAKEDEKIEKIAQEEFKKLENGDKENYELWKWFRDESIIELNKIYAEIGARFDVWIGESFFEKEMKSIVSDLSDRGITKRSEGAMVIFLDEFNLPPALIEKSDGASLYLTRDIANLRYRIEKYHPEKIFYITGSEQIFQFQQLFAVAKVLNMTSAELYHITYGLVLGEGGKKLSTREGRTISIKEILDKAIQYASDAVSNKDSNIEESERMKIAKIVGVGAIKFNDLKENRMTNIVFNWDKMLSFTGESGPYLQYTYARLKNILKKADFENIKNISRKDTELLEDDLDRALMLKIFEFPDIVKKSEDLLMTSVLANYLYKLASVANKYYETIPIIKDENENRKLARLILIKKASDVLKDGLALLGIEVLEKI